ncbi:MAG: TIGR03621 family F420-dependent LLM class oxidoreductase [Acidimicrobiales bacterium]
MGREHTLGLRGQRQPRRSDDADGQTEDDEQAQDAQQEPHCSRHDTCRSLPPRVADSRPGLDLGPPIARIWSGHPSTDRGHHGSSPHLPLRRPLQTATDGPDWASQARRAEELGYSTLFLPDHFGDQLAPIPALMAAATATTELRVGALVFDNDYKHPVVLAKECATIDLLSGGRFELGLGAGWMSTDYEQAGMPMDEPKVRVDRMQEGIAVLKRAFADGAQDFVGSHYRITGYDALPKPAQRPHPPFLIGGGGKRVLSIAGREADIVGINPSIPNGAIDSDAARSGLGELTDQKLAWVKSAAGERYADLEINLLTYANVITDDRPGTLEQLAPLFGLSADELADYPYAWVGSIEEICEDLERGRERWDASYLCVQSASMETMAPVVAKLAGT